MKQLPTEILAHIVDHANTTDLPNLRLCNRTLCALSFDRFARTFFTEIRHCFTKRSLHSLVEITAHQYLGRFVETILLDDCRVSRVLSNTSESATQLHDEQSYLEADSNRKAIELLAKAFSNLNVERHLSSISVGIYHSSAKMENKQTFHGFDNQRLYEAFESGSAMAEHATNAALVVFAAVGKSGCSCNNFICHAQSWDDEGADDFYELKRSHATIKSDIMSSLHTSEWQVGPDISTESNRETKFKNFEKVTNFTMVSAKDLRVLRLAQPDGHDADISSRLLCILAKAIIFRQLKNQPVLLQELSLVGICDWSLFDLLNEVKDTLRCLTLTKSHLPSYPDPQASWSRYFEWIIGKSVIEELHLEALSADWETASPFLARSSKVFDRSMLDIRRSTNSATGQSAKTILTTGINLTGRTMIEEVLSQVVDELKYGTELYCD